MVAGHGPRHDASAPCLPALAPHCRRAAAAALLQTLTMGPSSGAAGRDGQPNGAGGRLALDAAGKGLPAPEVLQQLRTMTLEEAVTFYNRWASACMLHPFLPRTTPILPACWASALGHASRACPARFATYMYGAWAWACVCTQGPL
jgi:hypothetical protein